MTAKESFEHALALSATTSELAERRVMRSALGKFHLSTGRLLIVDPHTELDREPLGIDLPAGHHALVVFSARGLPALAQLVVRDVPVARWEHIETALVDSGLLAILDDASRPGLGEEARATGDDEGSLYDFFEDALADHEHVPCFIFDPGFDGTQTIALFKCGDGSYPIWVGRDADGEVASVVVDFRVLRAGDGRSDMERYVDAARAHQALRADAIADALAAIDARDHARLSALVAAGSVGPHDIAPNEPATLLSLAIETKSAAAVGVLARDADLTLPVFLRGPGVRTYFELATKRRRADLAIAELLRAGHVAALERLTTPRRMPLAEAMLLMDPVTRARLLTPDAAGEALVVDGDWRVDLLDLDALGAPEPTLVLVTGSLETRAIVCTSDRPASVAIVDNLVCNDCVFGPQVLDVGGDCSLSGLFFGESAGTLHVTGVFAAQVLVALGGYAVQLASPDAAKLTHSLVEDELHPGEKLTLDRYLVPERMDRHRLGAALRQGRSVLQPPGRLGRPSYPTRFGDVAFADAATLAAMERPFAELFAWVPKTAPEQAFDLDPDTTVYVNRSHKRKTDGRKTEDCIVCVGPGDVELYVTKRRGIQMVGRGAGRNSVADVFDHPALLAIGQRVWSETFERASARAHLQPELEQLVSSRAIIDLVSTPVVRARYDRWDSDDDDDPGYFWRGRHFFQFKSATRDDPRTIVRVGEEKQSVAFDVASFDFVVDEDRPDSPWRLTYRSSQEGDARDRYAKAGVALSLLEPLLLEKAMALFRLARHAVAERQESFTSGA